MSSLFIGNFRAKLPVPGKGVFREVSLDAAAHLPPALCLLSGGFMKKIVVVAVFASLAACASTQTVLSEPPTQVFHSADSQTKVAFCLANKNNTAALDQEDGSKVVLIKNGYGGVSMAFSIYPEATGSRIEYRKKFGTIGGIWRQCIGTEAQHAELMAPAPGALRS